MAVQWTPDMAVGVTLIDEQHKEIFAKTSDVLEAINAGKSKEEVARFFKFLGSYVVMHFGDEEREMAAAGYPDLAAHKRMHAQFIEEFGKLKADFEKEGSGLQLALKLNRVVVYWLMQHIGKVDREAGRFIRERRKAA